jgi:hypothetical protein
MKIKIKIAMKIEELEEKVMNLSKTRNEVGTSLNKRLLTQDFI